MSKLTTKTKFKSVYKKHKQKIRAFIGWVGGIAIQVSAVGVDSMMGWDRKRWVFTIAVACIPGVVGWMKGGESNPTDEELYDKVHAVKQKRIDEKLEVTDPNGIPLKKSVQP